MKTRKGIEACKRKDDAPSPSPYLIDILTPVLRLEFPANKLTVTVDGGKLVVADDERILATNPGARFQVLNTLERYSDTVRSFMQSLPK